MRAPFASHIDRPNTSTSVHLHTRCYFSCVTRREQSSSLIFFRIPCSSTAAREKEKEKEKERYHTCHSSTKEKFTRRILSFAQMKPTKIIRIARRPTDSSSYGDLGFTLRHFIDAQQQHRDEAMPSGLERTRTSLSPAFLFTGKQKQTIVSLIDGTTSTSIRISFALQISLSKTFDSRVQRLQRVFVQVLESYRSMIKAFKGKVIRN